MLIIISIYKHMWYKCLASWRPLPVQSPILDVVLPAWFDLCGDLCLCDLCLCDSRCSLTSMFWFVWLPAKGVTFPMESIAVETVEGALFFFFERVKEMSAVNTSGKHNSKYSTSILKTKRIKFVQYWQCWWLTVNRFKTCWNITHGESQGLGKVENFCFWPWK